MTKNDFTEVKVVISDGEQKLTRKYPLYHSGFFLSHDDEQLKGIVSDAKEHFKGAPEEVVIHIKYIWSDHG